MADDHYAYWLPFVIFPPINIARSNASLIFRWLFDMIARRERELDAWKKPVDELLKTSKHQDAEPDSAE